MGSTGWMAVVAIKIQEGGMEVDVEEGKGPVRSRRGHLGSGYHCILLFTQMKILKSNNKK